MKHEPGATDHLPLPDKSGLGGAAWALDTDPRWPATIAAWLVHAPTANPVWQFWMVAVVHLRDLPNHPPAYLRYPTAGYELAIRAINPIDCPAPDHRHPEFLAYLHPPDLLLQFSGPDDLGASAVCNFVVETVVEGVLSPDSDNRNSWKAVLRDIISAQARDAVEVANHPSNRTPAP